MKRHLEYFRYVMRHKWYVFKGCMRLGVPLWRAIVHDWTKFLPIEWSPYAHQFFNGDGSRRKQSEPGPSAEQAAAFLKAWNHHESHNPHHWGYWITFTRIQNRYAIQAHGDGYPMTIYDFKEAAHLNHELDDDSFGKNQIYPALVEIRDRLNRDSHVVALEMPETYVREMIADWIGAGMAINGVMDPKPWWEKNRSDMILHPRTYELVEKILETL